MYVTWGGRRGGAAEFGRKLMGLVGLVDPHGKDIHPEMGHQGANNSSLGSGLESKEHSPKPGSNVWALQSWG